jgi:hypothetical protein
VDVHDGEYGAGLRVSVGVQARAEDGGDDSVGLDGTPEKPQSSGIVILEFRNTRSVLGITERIKKKSPACWPTARRRVPKGSSCGLR